jgi:DNA replication protein DnaC
MDHLPDEAAVTEASCPQHGPFTSRRLLRSIWSKCPTCVEGERAEAERVEREQAARQAEERHAAMLTQARIPARFRGRSFDNFTATTEAQRHALTVCRDFAENFAEHARRGASLILAGKPGTGKSHLAGAILQSILSPEVRYATCMDLIRAVRDTWRRDSEQSETQVLRYFEQLDLLAIDEIGMQYGTEGEQTVLFDVLDRRYREVRPTVLLTNQDKAGFRTFVGDRTFDRLSETARWVPFDWESHRPTLRKAA